MVGRFAGGVKLVIFENPRSAELPWTAFLIGDAEQLPVESDDETSPTD